MLKEVYDLTDLQNWEAATAGLEPPVRLAVIGDPVAHSKSPQMHNAALVEEGWPLRYARLHLREMELLEGLRRMKEAAFIGFNVTIPHKAAVRALVDRVDPHAERVGVVNTVKIEGAELVGYNTDGPGLVRALRGEFGAELGQLRVLILGAGGGAGRAIAQQCAFEGCPRLSLVNRTFAKAEELAAELAAAAVPWEEESLRRELEQTDLVINCTSLGMKETDLSPLPATWLRPRHLVFDTIYSVRQTKLVQAAEEAGARSANGLTMLLHQGALAFEIWFQRPAPVECMRAALFPPGFSERNVI